MEPARQPVMNKDYIDEDQDFGAEYYEDPEQTPQFRWRWVLPVLAFLLVPALGAWALRETSRDNWWPERQKMLNGLPGAVGTSGNGESVSTSMVIYSIHEMESLAGLNDGRPLVGRKVELQAPILEIANDQAFWIGGKENRMLVVPHRDNRDAVQRQAGGVADNGVGPLEAGKTASIDGTIRPAPNVEEMYSWGLSTRDRDELGARGVYLQADKITVQ